MLLIIQTETHAKHVFNQKIKRKRIFTNSYILFFLLIFFKINFLNYIIINLIKKEQFLQK